MSGDAWLVVSFGFNAVAMHGTALAMTLVVLALAAALAAAP